MLNVNVPAAVGVPDIAPVAEFSDNPGGKAVGFTTFHVRGGNPPVAVNVTPGCGLPTTPSGMAGKVPMLTEGNTVNAAESAG
jgi:hypothetical protein